MCSSSSAASLTPLCDERSRRRWFTGHRYRALRPRQPGLGRPPPNGSVRRVASCRSQLSVAIQAVTTVETLETSYRARMRFRSYDVWDCASQKTGYSREGETRSNGPGQVLKTTNDAAAGMGISTDIACPQTAFSGGPGWKQVKEDYYAIVERRRGCGGGQVNHRVARITLLTGLRLGPEKEACVGDGRGSKEERPKSRPEKCRTYRIKARRDVKERERDWRAEGYTWRKSHVGVRV